MSNSTAASDGDDDADLWWLGVIFSILGSLGTSTGMMMQKVGHLRNERLPEAERKSAWEMPLSWLGLVFMTLVPAPFDIAALAFARYSVLAPFSGVTLVINALVANRVLGEEVGYIDWLSSGLICAGTALTTLCGSHHAEGYNVPVLYDMYKRPPAIAYAGSMAISMLAGILFWKIFEGAIGRRGRLQSSSLTSGDYDQSSSLTSGDYDALTAAVNLAPRVPGDASVASGKSALVAEAAAFAAGRAAEADESGAPSLAREKNANYSSLQKSSHSGNEKIKRKWIASCSAWGVAPFVLAWMNGLIGSLQQVFMKTEVELIKTSCGTSEGVEKSNQFEYVLTYAVLLTTIACGIVQIRMLNSGLEQFDVIVYVPMYNSVLILTGVLSGWFFFGDLYGLAWAEICWFGLGSALTISGVLLLTKRPYPKDHATSVISLR